jgi:3-methyladenine DNA glycosylase AlkD
MTSDQVIQLLKSQQNPIQAKNLARFFKTGKGEYAEGDIFWGIMTPVMRSVTKDFRQLPFDQIETLIQYPVHEVRSCGLQILVYQAPQNPLRARNLYLENTQFINNWDLVDLTADRIVGPTLNPSKLDLLVKLAHSKLLWERRIAIMSTFYFIKQGNPHPTLEIAPLLIPDSHDLIHKATGWMLREVGKRCSLKIETDFLDKFATKMPRTMLRYAIERFPEPLRLYYLHLKEK